MVAWKLLSSFSKMITFISVIAVLKFPIISMVSIEIEIGKPSHLVRTPLVYERHGSLAHAKGEVIS